MTRQGQDRTAPNIGPLVGIDLLRLAAALFVVVYHFAYFSWHEPAGAFGGRAAIGVPVAYPALLPLSWWGWVGVEIFFVISGLVVCLSAESCTAAGFLRNRVLRLAPALWFFATLSLAATFLYATAPVGAVLAMYLRSVVLFPQGPWVDGVYWTLTIEVVFYMLTAVLIATGWRSRLGVVAVASSTLLLGFQMLMIAARVWPDLAFAAPVRALGEAYAARVLLLTTGAYFLVGVSLFLLARDGWNSGAAISLAAAVAAGSIGIWFTAERSTAVAVHGMSPVVPLGVWLAGVAVAGLSVWARAANRLPRGLRGLARAAGLTTYPLYLFHNITGAICFGLLLRIGIGDHLALGAAIALCLAVSAGFALRLEPALRRRLNSAIPDLRRSWAALRIPALTPER